MKILFITQYFPPESGAAPTRAIEFARNLVQLGHEVFVVTGFPNHPTGIIQDSYKGKWFQKENYHGIKIIRTYTYSHPNKSLINRFLNFVSFTLSSFIGLLFCKNPDVILLTIPPLTLGLSVIVYNIFNRVPLVLDVRDLWPQAAVELGLMKDNIIIKIFKRFALFLYKKANKITVVTEGIRESIFKNGISKTKIELITNGVNTEIFNKDVNIMNPYKYLGTGNKFIVVYSGLIGEPHGTKFIAKTASILSEEKKIVFVFIGAGVRKKELINEVKKNALENVVFIENQPVDLLVGYLNHANIGLATLKDIPFSDGIIPVKMFDYMACRLPVILAGSGESRKLVIESKSGIYIDSENAEQLAEAIMKLYNDPSLCEKYGISGEQYVQVHYSRHLLAMKMESILKEVVTPIST